MYQSANFNTSHVTVYRIIIVSVLALVTDFNTSHVTVYQQTVLFQRKINVHFNTSHVTVYPSPFSYSAPIGIFQYISCYGLSLQEGKEVKLKPNFNTSHVTVYRLLMSRWQILRANFNTSHVTVYRSGVGNCDSAINIFQYISCYGLSYRTFLEVQQPARFQYISCYGLSNDFKPFLSWHLSSFPLFYVISAFFTSRL